MFTYDPASRSTGSCQSEDHLYRRRRRHLAVELGDVDDIWPHRAAQDREIVGLVTYVSVAVLLLDFASIVKSR